MKMKGLLVSAMLLMGLQGSGFALAPSDPPGGPKSQVTVAFYNLENLFDTKDDPNINDEDFLPNGANQWTDARKAIKLDNLSRVINELGDEDGPELLGVCEVENRAVLEELVAHKTLKKKGYAVAHVDSPDERGIDCALLYKKKRFLPLYTQAYAVKLPSEKDRTRDVLLVKGILDNKYDLTVMVNHWPSRRGGASESAPARAAAAATVRHIVDSIQTLDPHASIIIMGDLNDGPKDLSLQNVLRAGRDSVEAMGTLLYNCMYKLDDEGQGTLMYKGDWDLFDQIIVSVPMVMSRSPLRYTSCSAGIYNPTWMQVAEGEYKGASKRMYIGKNFKEDGYSDHFPVYIHLQY